MQRQICSSSFIYETQGIDTYAERPSVCWIYAAVSTTLHPSPTIFAISSFLCGNSPRANATSFHCRSVSALARRGASLPASCLACLSYSNRSEKLLIGPFAPSNLTFSMNPAKNFTIRLKLSSSNASSEDSRLNISTKWL